jgi:hypothetical protein
MNRRTVLIILISGLYLSSCTREKGDLVDFSANAPVLLSASVAHAVLNLDADTTGAVIPTSSGTFEIRTSAAATAFEADGRSDLREVAFTVYKTSSANAIARGTLQRVSGQSDTVGFSGPISFVVRRIDAGPYVVELQAMDQSGLRSSAARVRILVVRNNSRPYLSSLVAPDTIKRPSSGFQLVLFSVAASDSDGYSDLAEVFFQRISPTVGEPIPMYDSGNRIDHGDEFPGDGIFSRLVRVDSTNTLGLRTFLFQGRDQFGAVSDSLTHILVIVE